MNMNIFEIFTDSFTYLERAPSMQAAIFSFHSEFGKKEIIAIIDTTNLNPAQYRLIVKSIQDTYSLLYHHDLKLPVSG